MSSDPLNSTMGMYKLLRCWQQLMSTRTDLLFHKDFARLRDYALLSVFLFFLFNPSIRISGIFSTKLVIFFRKNEVYFATRSNSCMCVCVGCACMCDVWLAGTLRWQRHLLRAVDLDPAMVKQTSCTRPSEIGRLTLCSLHLANINLVWCK